jgi:hypothetical protein
MWSWVRVSHAQGKYLWPSEEELKTLESAVTSEPDLWTKLFPDTPTADKTGTIKLWNRDGWAGISDHFTGPLKGDYVDTSHHIRKINSLLQIDQPLWKKLEDLSALKKQRKEIKAFIKKEQKESAEVGCLSYELDGSDSESPCDNDVQVNSNHSLASKFSYKTAQVNMLPSSSPIMKTDIFIKGLTEQLNIIEKDVKATKQEIFRILGDSSTSNYSPFPPGPVGDSPLHACFLLGLRRLGIEIVQKYYDAPELLSICYLNDLDPWRKVVGGASKLESQCSATGEDGLYTGETVLHIAIVQEDAALVKHLLHLGIEISSRAIGVFFQPKLLNPLTVELNRRQRLMAWILGLDLKGSKFAAVSSIENKYSGTYYGEYPLSFAASVGNLEICNIIYYYKKLRIDTKTSAEECKMTKRERDPRSTCPIKMMKDQRGRSSAKINQHVFSVGCEFDGLNSTEQLMWEFLNAADSFGNTALHMAVWHQRTDIIDWLVSKKGGEDSLNMINHEYFTPLTLAARRGHVDIFHHILYKHMGKTAWVYGKVGSLSFIFIFRNSELAFDTFRFGWFRRT